MTSQARIAYEQRIAEKTGAPPFPESANTADEIRSGQIWAPNRLKCIKLPCGCSDIPWPIVHVFGENFVSLWCEVHGTVHLSKNWKENARKKAKEYAQKRSEQLELDDIPPF
jgi:hypothetical protein